MADTKWGALNPKNIVLLLQRSFDSPEYDLDSVITEEERSFAANIENLIKDAIDAEMFFESMDTLTFNDENVCPQTVACNDASDSNFEESFKDCKKTILDVDIDYKKAALRFWRSGKTKALPLKSVQHQFRKVPDLKALYRWEEQIKEGGSRNDKLLQISQYVLDQFKICSEKLLPIHDIDIKRWVLMARSEVNLTPTLFTASSFWLYTFKLSHGIVSRKINKFVTKKQISSREKLLEAASEFVSKVKSEITSVGGDNVYNSDQSGFNLETHAGRTLSTKGSSKVQCLAQSLSSLTHSYTIQPIVSASGDLKSPLLIVLQEASGKFGPIVEKTLYKADNIAVFATKSGKLTSDLAINWFKSVFLPNTGGKSVLLLDSWTGQTEKKFDNIDKGNKSIDIFTIPAGTTGCLHF